MSSGSGRGRGWWLVGTVGVGIVLLFGGWGSSLAQTDTEHEAEETLSNLKINLTGDPNVAMPDIYTAPPKIFEQIVGGKSEWKLFYLCRYQTSDELKKIVHEQFASKVFNEKGKSVTVVDYTVSSNPATNQLIVRCPTREDIEAVLETLNQIDISPIQVKIDCLVSEVYADMTFDRETTLAISNLFGEDLTMKPSGTSFGSDVRQLILDGDYLPAFPGASMREVARSRMGLNIGYFGDDFVLLVDLLESRGYLKILMNPTLEVVNGGTAKVLSSQKVPIDRTTMRSTQSDYLETKTEYEDVVDSLEVTAHVFADGYIGLETTVLLGSKNTPEGVKQIPIITKKEIENKNNRIRQGDSLIIGGIRKNEEYAVVRGVPILKDIPLLGYLFSSEDTEQRAVETIFILTPTISTDGRPREEVMREVQRKHEPDTPAGLGEMISDPFGLKAKEQSRERAMQEAEQSRLDAEVEKAQARIDVREANERTEKAQAELSRLEAEAEKIKSDAEAKAIAAEQAKAAADKAIADAKKAQASADKAKAEADAKLKAAEKDKEQDSGASGAGAKKPAPENDKPKAEAPKEGDKAKG